MLRETYDLIWLKLLNQIKAFQVIWIKSTATSWLLENFPLLRLRAAQKHTFEHFYSHNHAIVLFLFVQSLLYHAKISSTQLLIKNCNIIFLYFPIIQNADVRNDIF